MAHISSEIEDVPYKEEAPNSEMSIRPALCDHTYPGDLDLRSLIEEKAFQALCEETLIKIPCYTFTASEPDEDNAFLSMTFPRKLWKIVESDQFKSIWWGEKGTSIVINEELFKKEVLQRKAPFKIFETDNMKSFIRQLNLYGFSKMRQDFLRSASLIDFLAEEKGVSVLNKLQFYYNPNFKRGCPQLLVRMRRRLGIKNASSASSSVQDFNEKHFREEDDVDNHNSGFIADMSGESVFSHSTNLNMPLITNSTTSQVITKTTAPIRSDFADQSSVVRPLGDIIMNPCAISNHLTTFPVYSHGSYTQANTHNLNFIATSTASQSHISSLLQTSYFERNVRPSSFQNTSLYPSAMDGLPTNLPPAGNTCLSMSMIANTSAPPPPSLHVHHLPYNSSTKDLPDAENSKIHDGRWHQSACNSLFEK